MNSIENIVQKINSIGTTENFEQKKELAEQLANKVKDGEIIGFGSGTTSFIAVIAIANKVKTEKLNIIAVPTSNEIEQLCNYYQIETKTLNDVKLNWAFDGTDEVDMKNNLIKGKGRCMFREKLNFLNAPKVYILADESKYVADLGENCPIPVECYKGAVKYVQSELTKLGATSCELVASNDGKLAITDLGNYIINAKFNSVNINKKLEDNMKLITGVIETGLFFNYKNVEILK